MTNILVYGSLLATSELNDIFGEQANESIPVWVEGYRRTCDQRSSYREPETNRTVMNTAKDSTSQLNAILIPSVPESAVESYQNRESGYGFEQVPAANIRPYHPNDSIPLSDEDHAIIAVGEKVTDQPQPIEIYVRECITAASEWGDRFLADFVFTTDLE